VAMMISAAQHGRSLARHLPLTRSLYPAVQTSRQTLRWTKTMGCTSRCWFSGDTSNDPVWNEMSEKTRALAKMLIDKDHVGQKQHNFNRRKGLSQAITLIESRNATHQRQAGLLLKYLLANEDHFRMKSSFRLGIAGPPGELTLHILRMSCLVMEKNLNMYPFFLVLFNLLY
jgi:hypothetical protein